MFNKEPLGIVGGWIWGGLDADIKSKLLLRRRTTRRVNMKIFCAMNDESGGLISQDKKKMGREINYAKQSFNLRLLESFTNCTWSDVFLADWRVIFKVIVTAPREDLLISSQHVNKIRV